jgi:hypothetical protein
VTARLPGPPRGLRALGWALLLAGLAGGFYAQHHALTLEREMITRKDRLIRSVMFHVGWRPETIEAIAAGRIDPYSPEAAPERD